MSGKDENKVYYWMAQKEDFYNTPAMDVLFDQEDGFAYVTLYSQLCLLTINSQGYLVSKIGKTIYPYTAKKIARATKYYSEEFVKKALNLYIDLELIMIGINGYKFIPEVQQSIGSSSNDKSAKQKAKSCAKKRAEKNVNDFFEISSNKEIPQSSGEKFREVVEDNSEEVRKEIPPQYTDYSIQITDNRNTIIDDVDLKNNQNLIHLSVERDAEESLKNCKSKNAKELLNALASPKTNWDTIIPVEYIRECEAYTTPEIADKEYMLLKKVKNSFNKRDSKTISLATSEQVYSILDAVKAVVTGEMETPVMNQSGYIANCFRNTFRL